MASAVFEPMNLGTRGQHAKQQTTLLFLNPLLVSGIKRPSSGGTKLAVFGVSCVRL
jgi:hypothetical protein